MTISRREETYFSCLVKFQEAQVIVIFQFELRLCFRVLRSNPEEVFKIVETLEFYFFQCFRS